MLYEVGKSVHVFNYFISNAYSCNLSYRNSSIQCFRTAAALAAHSCADTKSTKWKSIPVAITSVITITDYVLTELIDNN